MIRPAELRLNNLVSTHMGIGAIQQLRENYARVCVQDDNQVSRILDYDMLEGIPLTPEWLEGLGFFRNDSIITTYNRTLSEGRFFKQLSLSICDDKGMGEYYVMYRDGHTRFRNEDDVVTLTRDTRCVHQLQNLYHALTGNELEVKV